jgi:hypothetical protein
MNSHEIWHVDVQNNIYEASYEEVIQWIKEGAILPEDKVRRGNLRWLSANKVPEFNRYFLQTELNVNFSAVPLGSTDETNEVSTRFQNGAPENSSAQTQTLQQASVNVSYHSQSTPVAGQNQAPYAVAADSMFCSVHPERERYYICQICKIIFCKECPHSFGSSVKICLDCGGMCITYAEFEKLEDKTIGAINRPYARIEARVTTDPELEADKRAKLSKKDFFDAMIYPLKFPAAFIFGSVLLAVLTLGQMIWAIGGIDLFFAAVGVSAFMILLVFSVLTKTVENTLHDKTQAGFMPRVNRFTVWEDFVHPFFLGAGALLAAFGLFLSLVVGAGAYAWSQFSGDLGMTEIQMRASNNQVDAAFEQFNDKQVSGRAFRQNALERKIEQNLQTQTERVFGSNYLGDAGQLEKLVKSMLRLSIYFQMPICFAFIFGLLLFPAVCLNAGSTRSLGKTVNFFRGWKTIKKLGFDYIKILMMCLAFTAVTFTVAAGIFFLFSTLDQLFFRIIGALTAASVAAFYFWIVFSQIISIALDKKQTQESI